MCGIAAYIGERDSLEILFGMLERLEYRGYDSAGVALATGNGLMTAKDEGRVHEVHRLAEESWSSNGGSLSRGLSHCRWATHGKPSKANAHPHADCTGQILVVHNGIVENYMQLKEELLARGHEFVSATDTEVIPHLIEELSDGDFEKAFRDCLVRLEGSFAVCAMSVDEPDRLFVARKESPLIIGLGDGENFVASDAPAVIPETRDVIYLDDFDYAVVGKDGVQTKNLRTGAPIVRQPKKVDWDVGRAEKGGHDHFMLKEILEEPEAVSNALKAMRDIERITKKLAKFNRIYFVACGTAAYAGLCGKYLLERFAIPSETVLGSEFRYSTALTIDPNCAVVALSQSGETADTIASVKEAKKRGAYVVSIVNAIGST
ncbi:MAG: glutamine--fructose-6-phosphate transaminase (isomerizing), partial [Terriglobia bacterium]